MSPEPGAGHAELADWDAAYVLGSLTPADRRRFETHLADCPRCRTAVADLSGLPGLLGAVPLDRVLTAADPEVAPPPDLLPRLVGSVQDRRVRRVRFAVGGGLAAAAAVAVVVVVAWPGSAPSRPVAAGPTSGSVSSAPVGPLPPPGLGTSPVASLPAGSVSLQLQQIVASPLDAKVTLVPEPWGTRVDLHCGFGDDGGSPGPDQTYGYSLFLTNRAGITETAANWTYGPGTSVEPVGSSRWPVAQIAVIEIRSADGETLLRTTR